MKFRGGHHGYRTGNDLGRPPKLGYLSEVTYSKESRIWGSILGSPYLWALLFASESRETRRGPTLAHYKSALQGPNTDNPKP